MPLDLDELHTAAKLIAAVCGLLSVLPFTRLFKPLRILVGDPMGLKTLGGLTTLGAFLLTMYFRRVPSPLFDYWLWLALGLLFGIILFCFGHMSKRNNPVLVALLYCTFLGATALWLTGFVADTLIFYKLQGSVEFLEDGPVESIHVFLQGSERGERWRTDTNGAGEFRFYLTKQEALSAVHVVAETPVRSENNWQVIEWAERGRTHTLSNPLKIERIQR